MATKITWMMFSDWELATIEQALLEYAHNKQTLSSEAKAHALRLADQFANAVQVKIRG